METVTTTTTAVILPSPLQLIFGGVLVGLGIKASSEAWDYSKSKIQNRALLKAAASENKATKVSETVTVHKVGGPTAIKGKLIVPAKPVAKKPATKTKKKA